MTNDHMDSMQGNGDNGDGRGNHGLMVREYEMNGLSPYMTPGMPAPYVDGTPSGMNFSQLAHAFRRRWLLALIAGLIVGLPVAALVWLVTPENYEVVAWLRVGDAPGELRNPSEYDKYRTTQAARIKSPIVLQAALRTPGISELPMIRNEREPIQFLQDELAVVSPLESEVLLIKMRGKDAQQLVKIVNAVHDAALDRIVEGERGQLYDRQNLLQLTLKEKDDELRSKQERLVAIKKSHNSAALESTKFSLDTLRNRAFSLYQGIQSMQKELREVNTKLASITEKKKNGEGPSEYMIQSIMGKNDRYADMTKSIAQTEAYISHEIGVSRLGPRDPSIVSLRRSLAGSKDQLSKLEEELRPQIIAYLETQSDTPGGLPTDPRQLEITKQKLEESIADSQANYEDLSKSVAELAQDTADIETYESQIKGANERRSELLKDLDDVNLRIKQPPRVTSLEKASPPEGTNPVFRYVLTAFACILGIAIGAGAVVGMEYQAQRLSTTGEISTGTGLRVLGTVPNLDALSQSKAGAAALQGILSESVDSIRTVLLQQSRDKTPRVIMVTSACDREGKTTVASHLAASLARSGKRTLLVDGDLRSPTAHAMFGAALDPGLCEILRGEMDLESAIQPTQVDGLMLVAAGHCDYQSIASLSKGTLREIFEKAREQFDFVVVDAAPVLSYADTLLVGSHADAVVLSVRRDVSQLRKVHEARDRMESVGIRVIGAVVNGISEVSRRPAFALPSAEA
jgi:succinoglycan biosynthesis transport protein ExoP